MEYNTKHQPAPCASRVETAFKRYLILGQFSEIQLIAPGSEGKTMYQVFTSPDLTSSDYVTIERLTFKQAQVTITNANEVHADSYADQKRIHEATKVLTFKLPITAKTGDGDLITAVYAARLEAIRGEINKIYPR